MSQERRSNGHGRPESSIQRRQNPSCSIKIAVIMLRIHFRGFQKRIKSIFREARPTVQAEQQESFGQQIPKHVRQHYNLPGSIRRYKEIQWKLVWSENMPKMRSRRRTSGHDALRYLSNNFRLQVGIRINTNGMECNQTQNKPGKALLCASSSRTGAQKCGRAPSAISREEEEGNQGKSGKTSSKLVSWS